MWMQEILRWVPLWASSFRDSQGRITQPEVWQYIARLIEALHDPCRAGSNLNCVLKSRRETLTPPAQAGMGGQSDPTQCEECIRAFREAVSAMDADDAEMGGGVNAPEIAQRLEQIEASMRLIVARQPEREDYTTEAFALVVQRAEFTVREWCRKRRINAEKMNSGRGVHQSWRITHSELLRYQREGLLPS